MFSDKSQCSTLFTPFILHYPLCSIPVVFFAFYIAGRRQFAHHEWAQKAAYLLGCTLEELSSSIFKNQAKGLQHSTSFRGGSDEASQGDSSGKNPNCRVLNRFCKITCRVQRSRYGKATYGHMLGLQPSISFIINYLFSQLISCKVYKMSNVVELWSVFPKCRDEVLVLSTTQNYSICCHGKNKTWKYLHTV